MPSLIQEKVDQTIATLRQTGLDAWLAFVREASAISDPVLPLACDHLVHFDFGVRQDDYCSDIQRVVHMLRPGEIKAPEPVQRGFAVVRAAGEAARTAMRTGASGGEVDALALQPSSKIVIGGKSASVGGAERKRIARLKPDGALDAGLDPRTGAIWKAFAVTLQPDGRVRIGGAFQTISGVWRNRIARL